MSLVLSLVSMRRGQEVSNRNQRREQTETRYIFEKKKKKKNNKKKKKKRKKRKKTKKTPQNSRNLSTSGIEEHKSGKNA